MGNLVETSQAKKNCGKIIFTRYGCYMCVKLLWQGCFVNAVMIVNTSNNPDKFNFVLEGFTFISLLRKFSDVTK